MSERTGWILVFFLLISLAGQGWMLLHRGSGFSTLPIFVPVSLEYEKQLRNSRQQPASRSGDQLMALAQSLEQSTLPPEVAARLKPSLDALFKTRLQLLEARNRRHTLNIALMDVGIQITHRLRPEQWEKIHMRRDALRAKAESEVFERLERKLGP